MAKKPKRDAKTCAAKDGNTAQEKAASVHRIEQMGADIKADVRQDSDQDLRKGTGQAADRAGQTSGVGESRRPEGGCPVRRPRRRRQGWHNQADHRVPEPAGVPRVGTGDPDGTRENAMVLSALCAASAGGRARSCCSTAAGTNRAGVERVMGFCTDEEYEEFMRSCPEFERMLVRSGIKLIKYWFSVSGRGTGTPLPKPHHRSHQTLETEPDGSGVTALLGRVLQGQGTSCSRIPTSSRRLGMWSRRM